MLHSGAGIQLFAENEVLRQGLGWIANTISAVPTFRLLIFIFWTTLMD